MGYHLDSLHPIFTEFNADSNSITLERVEQRETKECLYLYTQRSTLFHLRGGLSLAAINNQHHIGKYFSQKPECVTLILFPCHSQWMSGRD